MSLSQLKQRQRWLSGRHDLSVLGRFSSVISSMVVSYSRRMMRKNKSPNTTSGAQVGQDVRNTSEGHSNLQTSLKSPVKRRRLLRTLGDRCRRIIPPPTLPFLRSLPVALYFGFGLFTRLLSFRKRKGRFAVNRRTLKNMYVKLPFNTTSRFVGRICKAELPRFARRSIYSAFIRSTKIDISEAIDNDLRNYPSLSALFQRRLKPELREINLDASVVSPCDGVVVHHGLVHGDCPYQIKSARYRLAEFLGPVSWNRRPEDVSDPPQSDDKLITDSSAPENSDSAVDFDQYVASLKLNQQNELYYVNLYLSPRDYHRFHSPVDWTVHFRRHVPGALLSVHERVAGYIENLYAVNERVVYVGEWQHGFFSMSAVGATNVGSIQTVFDEGLETNTKRRRNELHAQERVFEEGVKMSKGQEFGAFNLGSTIVLVFEAPAALDFVSDAKRFPIQYGQALLR